VFLKGDDMAKRNYGQFCPLAYALDLVGERWTLLIVRELQLGPRRFTDLQRGLPGMNPNLLAQRLRRLGQLGVISKEPLPPPARSQAYCLTLSGQALNRALMPLAEWGMRFLQIPAADDEFLGSIPAMAALRLLYQPDSASEQTLAAEIHLAPDIFSLRLTPAEIDIVQGYLPDAPLVLSTDPKSLIGLAAGLLGVSDAERRNLLKIAHGSPDLAAALFAQFALPETVR
jgi:DNA-binding HxlR family transcriptional regulator